MSASEVELKHHIAELEEEACGFEKKYKLLMSEKMDMEEVRLTLESKVDDLSHI